MSTPKRITIDADVICSSGEGSESSHACRAFLNEVFLARHYAYYNTQLHEEWNMHASRFGSRWLVAMNDRKLLVRSTEDVLPALRAEILEKIQGTAEKAAIEKDVHLIEIATQIDEIVVSCDETTRGILKRISLEILKVSRLIWINPTLPEESALKWVTTGAALDGSRRLGSVETA